MEDIEITQATINDIPRLQQIGRRTFLETFSGSNSEENMSKYLEEGFAVEKLTGEMCNKDSRFFFALLDGEVIGYLKLNAGQSQTELQDDRSLEIERIYVLASYHGRKVGALLYNKALEIAGELNAEYLWLGVWERNERAIRFYQKNGFVAFDKHIFRLGEDEQTDILMKKILRP